MRHLVIERLHVLAPPIVFSQQKAVISAYDQQGVFPQSQFIHQIQHPAQMRIAHAHQRRVLKAHVLHLQRRLAHLVIIRPVKVRAVILVRVQVFVFLRGKERLVRVKGLNLQEPVVLSGVGADEFLPQFKGHMLRVEFLIAYILPVHPILSPIP